MFLAHVTDMYNNCTADSYKDSGAGWYNVGGLSLASSCGVDELVVLGEGCGLSFLSIKQAIERKPHFFEGSGDWLLFCPWY